MTVIVLLLFCAASLLAGGSGSPNQLTAEEKAAGWVLLFDGESFAGWEGFNDTAVARQSWGIDDGAIRTLKDNSGGDMVTVRPYENFELQFEWKLSAGGNSGVKYLVQRDWISPAFTPDQPEAWKRRARLRATGLEYQLLDDSKRRGRPLSPYSSCGALYLLTAPKNKRLNPAGEWNHSRIVVRGAHGEHWLNGVKLLDYELNSPELLARVQETKFRRVPGYGIKGAGYIALTHHNSPAWFRGIKILELK